MTELMKRYEVEESIMGQNKFFYKLQFYSYFIWIYV